MKVVGRKVTALILTFSRIPNRACCDNESNKNAPCSSKKRVIQDSGG